MIRCALVDPSESIVFLDADRADRPHLSDNLGPILDSIYLGQVKAKSDTSYWVQLSSHCQGLLPSEKGLSRLTIGESVLVQVRREAIYDSAEQGFKQPLLTRKISYAGSACVYVPTNGPKPDIFHSRTTPAPVDVIREQSFLTQTHETVLAQASQLKAPACLLPGPLIWQRFIRDLPPVECILVDDMALLPIVQGYCHQWRPDLVDSLDRYNGNLFEAYSVADSFEDLFSQRVTFREGSIFIEETSVGITIDVNGEINQRRDVKTINSAAAEIIAHQLPHRSLSGRIIIDFINSGDGHRKDIENMLKSTLADSPIRYQILGWSKLGWLELMSEKRRTPLNQRRLGV